MPIPTSKGYRCEVCGEETYYEDTCIEHERECRREEAQGHESRMDELEERVAKIEKYLGFVK